MIVILMTDSSRYLGCVMDVGGEFFVKSLVNSEGTCRSTCMTSSNQFYSFYESQGNIELLKVKVM
jgi:hypothetical protein